MKNIILFIFLSSSLMGFAQQPITNKTEMCETLSKMLENDKLHRSKMPDAFSQHKSEYSKKEIDSMRILQREIDNYNTEKLIELTKKHGWISDESIDCPKLNVWLIFRHSQKKYFKQIDSLIEKEHNANRLNDFQYKMIRNHINERPRG